MADHKGKAAAAKASLAQPAAEPPPQEEHLASESAVGARLEEMVQHLLEYALKENLGPALDSLGSDFERRINATKAAALADFSERLTQMVAAEEDRMRQEITGAAAARFNEQLEQHSAQAMADSAARMKKEMEEATALVHQSFMRHIVTELGAKQTSFVEEAMKPLSDAAEQNLRRMRKELTRMVKEVGQRFVSGTESDE